MTLRVHKQQVVSGLSPNAVYRFRVHAINGEGVTSKRSGYTQAATPEVKEYEPPSQGNCELHMTVDCTNGDIVVGDMVLFTEPVYIKIDNTDDPRTRDAMPPEVRPPPLPTMHTLSRMTVVVAHGCARARARVCVLLGRACCAVCCVVLFAKP